MTDFYLRCNMAWTPSEFGGPGMINPCPPCPANHGPHVCHHHEAEMHVCACGSRTQGIVVPSPDP